MADYATEGISPDAAAPRLADRLAQLRREAVALAIESAALDLFAVRPITEVTVEEIAVRAGVAVRTLYRYFPSKDDIMLAYPRRAAEQLAALVRARPTSETPFEAVRQSLSASVGDPKETSRWVAAYAHIDTRERIARTAIEAMAAAFSEALADARDESEGRAVGGDGWLDGRFGDRSRGSPSRVQGRKPGCSRPGRLGRGRNRYCSYR